MIKKDPSFDDELPHQMGDLDSAIVLLVRHYSVV
jgi:hypothetical protein